MNFFELSVAFKYLKPRWRQLSVSIISLISILVISLVVWLIVVFFSVTHGLEKNWIQKLIALTAPIRISPTEAYYDSYYYKIDSISSNSDYTQKTIQEKLLADSNDPYDPTFDEELPLDWTPPDLDQKGNLKDIVKLAFESIHSIPNITASPYEMTFANLQVNLLRDPARNYLADTSANGLQNQSYLSQDVYIGSFDESNPLLKNSLIPTNESDIKNLLNTISLLPPSEATSGPILERLTGEQVLPKMMTLLKHVDLKKAITPAHGWNIPRELFSSNCSLEACAILDQDFIRKVVIGKSKSLKELEHTLKNQGIPFLTGSLIYENEKFTFKDSKKIFNILPTTPLSLEGGIVLDINLASNSSPINRGSQLHFQANIPVQEHHFIGEIPLGDLSLTAAGIQKAFNIEDSPYWIHLVPETHGKMVPRLPYDAEIGESILLPKSFKDAGVLVGDKGFISYKSPTASSMQEQKVHIFVAGFYDPGIIPLGGKLILASKDVTSFIRLSQPSGESSLSNGINVRFDDLTRADAIKATLVDAFKKANIDQYWTIQTYKDYEFTKDIIQQLHSEKNLFRMLAIVIIVVACSNIISMLIILVNDKKLEIGILRSMGASSSSIALIFGTCGIIMGLLGSIFGIILASLTLKNLQSIIELLSKLQGHEMFNPAFYGEILPNEVSFQALSFVTIMTIIISMVAGIVPAVKACLIRPSEILRAE